MFRYNHQLMTHIILHALGMGPCKALTIAAGLSMKASPAGRKTESSTFVGVGIPSSLDGGSKLGANFGHTGQMALSFVVVQLLHNFVQAKFLNNVACQEVPHLHPTYVRSIKYGNLYATLPIHRNCCLCEAI